MNLGDVSDLEREVRRPTVVHRWVHRHPMRRDVAEELDQATTRNFQFCPLDLSVMESNNFVEMGIFHGSASPEGKAEHLGVETNRGVHVGDAHIEMIETCDLGHVTSIERRWRAAAAMDAAFGTTSCSRTRLAGTGTEGASLAILGAA